MKKLIVLLLCIGSVIFPSLVHADMGSPELITYEVIVTNKDGAKDADSDTVIPYDTVCSVNYESNWKGKLELVVECKGYEDTLTINGEDVRILKEEYQPTKENKLEKGQKYYIYKDIEMYSGPSYKYKQIGSTIPAGSIVTITHVDTDVVWGYTEYNGQKGWVYIYWYDGENKIANVIEKEADKKIITVRKITKLYKYPNQAFYRYDEEYDEDVAYLDVSIPARTTLDAVYYYPILHEDGLFYIEYNGVSGWVDTYDGVAIRSSGSVLALSPKDINVYDEKFNKANINIGKYEDFTYNYKATFEEKKKDILVYAITYNKKNYFLEIKFTSEDDSYENDMLAEAYPYKIEVNNNAPLYETYEGKKEVGTVNKGVKMDREYSRYIEDLDVVMYFIRTDDVSGWVKDDFVNQIKYKEGEEMANIISSPFTTTTLITTESKNTTTKVANDNDKKDMTTKDIVTICVISAIVLALVVVVVIILVNRKKKVKTENLLVSAPVKEDDTIADSQKENKDEVDENSPSE